MIELIVLLTAGIVNVILLRWIFQIKKMIRDQKRKMLTCIIALLLAATIAEAQAVAEDKTDEFTGRVVKRTSYEKLTPVMFNEFHAYFRLSKVDSLYTFDLKLFFGDRSYFTIRQGDKLMFKLKDGSVHAVESLETKISRTGQGSIDIIGSVLPGVAISYGMNSDMLDALANNEIEKIRIYTSRGYVEKELKTKFGTSIKNAIQLIK